MGLVEMPAFSEKDGGIAVVANLDLQGRGVAGREGFGVAVHLHGPIVGFTGHHNRRDALGEEAPVGGDAKGDDAGMGPQGRGRYRHVNEHDVVLPAGTVGVEGVGLMPVHPPVDTRHVDLIVIHAHPGVFNGVGEHGGLSGLYAAVVGCDDVKVIVGKHHPLVQELNGFRQFMPETASPQRRSIAPSGTGIELHEHG